MRRFVLFCLSCCLLPIQLLSAAIFQLPELATADMGVAGAGSVAVGRDAATCYFNPAAMTLLRRNQLLLGGELFYSNTHFVARKNTPIHGGNGGKPTRLLATAGIYWVVEVCPRWKVGLSFNTPQFTYLNYRRKWAGRFLSQKTNFYTLCLNPCVAYAYNPHWSFGGGLSLCYGLLRERLAVNPSIYPKPTTVTQEGSIKDKFDHGSWGYNLGVLYVYDCANRCGLAFRSKSRYHFKGLPTYNPSSITPNPFSSATTSSSNSSASTAQILAQALMPLDNHVTTPASYNFGSYHRLTHRFAMLTEIGTTLWHQFRRNFVTSDNSGLVHRRRHWKDNYLAGLGLEYYVTERLTMQGGFSVESSPVNKHRQSADYPAYRQWRYAAGWIYNYNCCTHLSFAAEYLYMGPHPTISNRFLKGHFDRNNTLFCNFTWARLF